MTDISVVIPTRGNAQDLERCLAALAAQDFGGDRFEIVIADGVGDDRVRRMAERWDTLTRGAPRIRFLQATDARGVAGVRNAGWRAAEGEIIAFTSDRALPRRDWLSKGFRAMSDSGANAAAGIVITERAVSGELDAVDASRFGLVASNCFVTRQALRALRGFDERFTGGFDDDSDLQFRLIGARGEIVSANAVVEIPDPKAGIGATLREYRKFLFDALLLKKHPAMYRTRALHEMPATYFLAVVAMLVVLAAPLMQMPALASAGAVAWLILTAEITWQRYRTTSRGDLGDAILSAVAIPPTAVFWYLAGALRFRLFSL